MQNKIGRPKAHKQLTKPIPFRSFRLPTIFTGRLAHESPDFLALVESRLDTLFVAWGIDPTRVNRPHALALARRYVRGFQIERRRQARAKKWDDINLARLWLLFREARPNFPTDWEATVALANRTTTRKLAGKVKPIWIEQLLDRARFSPLVQMLESDNPVDTEFARRLLRRALPRE